MEISMLHELDFYGICKALERVSSSQIQQAFRWFFKGKKPHKKKAVNIAKITYHLDPGATLVNQISKLHIDLQKFSTVTSTPCIHKIYRRHFNGVDLADSVYTGMDNSYHLYRDHIAVE
eukprot:TRINITY_DN3393_c0_g1_i1.p1 TRINITY_DN3393_c0_g1~~TRINITY_DN3393_c0_g1_i1.p1  ORF type:complete len:136 (-),score=16.98 TRINITY_DN3393_c0_g1_i1:487-843(-)